MAPSLDIILYLYTFSPYARKVTTYLALRGISYIEVQQPFVMPRPDLAAIGVRYRRIPVMSIGRDIYCDSMLILEKLEQLYPASLEHPTLGAKPGTGKALEELLEKWASDLVFQKAVMTIPSNFPAMQDATFTKDRSELWGGEWGKDRQDKMRALGLQTVRECFDLLETLMADGKSWVLGEEGPSLADIHAMWVFDWLLGSVQGALPESLISRKKYPKTFTWRDRYTSAVDAAKAKLPEQVVIEGPEATRRITSSQFGEEEGPIDENDPFVQSLSLSKGMKVDVWPEDTTSGYQYREIGELVALTSREVVVGTKTKDREADVRIHAPRWNYKIQPASQSTNGVTTNST